MGGKQIMAMQEIIYGHIAVIEQTVKNSCWEETALKSSIYFLIPNNERKPADTRWQSIVGCNNDYCKFWKSLSKGEESMGKCLENRKSKRKLRDKKLAMHITHFVR